MLKSGTTNLIATEPHVDNHHHHLLCWKSTFSGLAIAFMALLVLTSLGVGIAGYTAESLMTNGVDGASALATGGGIWLGISIIAALFSGSYFALRVSRFVTPRIGAAHGFVIAALFFGLLVSGAGKIIGGVASGLGQFAISSVNSPTALGSDPLVQDSIYRALGTSTLKSEPRVVAEGLMARLSMGNTESARSFYAYQTGLSPAVVDARVAAMQEEFNGAVRAAGEKTANVVGDAGMSLFVFSIVGLIAALFGGRTGAMANVQRPIAKLETSRFAVRNEPLHV